MLNNVNIAKRIARTSALIAGLLLLNACATTQEATLDRTSINCGLLGDVCGKLTPGGKDQASLRYISPSTHWTHYDKVMIEPVTFWGGDSTSVSAADQQMLTNYFSQQLKKQFGKKFQIVDQAGPGVMKLTIAMIDAKTAMPVLRSISMIVPQAHMLSNLKYLATGTFPFVGGAQVEAKITDSVSGDLLAAVADKRIGGGNVKAGFQWQWGDAENVIDKWCERSAERLYSWTTGTATP